MARKTFLDQILEIRDSEEAKKAREAFRSVNTPNPEPRPLNAYEEHPELLTVAKAPESTTLEDNAHGEADRELATASPTHSPTHLFTQSQSHTPTHLLNHSAIHSLDQSDAHSPNHSIGQLPNQLLNHSDTRSPDYLLNQSPSDSPSHSLSHSGIHSATPSINQTLNQSNIQSVNQLDITSPNYSPSHSVTQLSNHLPIKSPNHSDIHSSDHSVVQSPDHSDTQSFDQLAVHSSNDLPNIPTEESQNPSPIVTSTGPSTDPSSALKKNTTSATGVRTSYLHGDTPQPLRGLTKNDLTIIHLIVEHDPLTTTLNKIADETQISINTIRSCLKKLKEKKVLDWERIVDGCTWATAFIVHERTKALYGTYREIIHSMIGGAKCYTFETRTAPAFISQNFHQMSHQNFDQNARQLIQHNAQQQPPSLDRKIKENLSICEELEKEAKRLYQLDDEDMQMFLPDLYRAGFTAVNVRSLVERRYKNGLDLSDPTVKMIHMGMRRADAALRIGEGSFKGTINTPIENIPGYVFSTLLKDASFPKPSAWEPEEVLAQQIELERLRQEAERQRLESEMRNKIEASLKAEREEQDYQVWRNALTPEEIETFRGRCPNKKSAESLERFLRVEWRKTLG